MVAIIIRNIEQKLMSKYPVHIDKNLNALWCQKESKKLLFDIDKTKG